MSDLRDVLVAAQLATEIFVASDGFRSLGVRSNEEAADVALAAIGSALAEARATGFAEAVALLRDRGEFAAWHSAERRPDSDFLTTADRHVAADYLAAHQPTPTTEERS